MNFTVSVSPHLRAKADTVSIMRDVVIALYDAVDTLERQIRKNKTRLEKQLRDTAFVPTGEDALEELAEEVIEISKVKSFALTEMTPEEAVMQMNLLAHNFYALRLYRSNNRAFMIGNKDALKIESKNT